MARTILIGDIHACWDELRALCERVALTDDDVVVSVGDVIDYGPEPGAVIDWLRTRPNTIAVCGNHERKHARGSLSFSQQVTRAQLGDRYEDAAAWMRTLPSYWETDAVRVVHAALIPGVPLADTSPAILCGTTSGTSRLEKRLAVTHDGRPWHEVYDDAKPVVFGHSLMGEAPLVRDGRVFGLDTGACQGLRLTALVLPTFEVVSVPARANHWEAVKRTWQMPVLRERPWGQMTFAQLDRKARELAAGRDPVARAWLDAARAWGAAVRGAIPTVTAAVDAEIERLTAVHGADGFAAAAELHPARSTIVARHAGRLKPDHLGCAGPDAVFALATRLNVALDLPRSP